MRKILWIETYPGFWTQATQKHRKTALKSPRSCPKIIYTHRSNASSPSTLNIWLLILSPRPLSFFHSILSSPLAAYTHHSISIFPLHLVLSFFFLPAPPNTHTYTMRARFLRINDSREQSRRAHAPLQVYVGAAQWAGARVLSRARARARVKYLRYVKEGHNARAQERERKRGRDFERTALTFIESSSSSRRSRTKLRYAQYNKVRE